MKVFLLTKPIDIHVFNFKESEANPYLFNIVTKKQSKNRSDSVTRIVTYDVPKSLPSLSFW